jgi:hypothetical protein
MHKFYTSVLVVVVFFIFPLRFVQAEVEVQHAAVNGIWQGSFDINGRGPFDFTAIHINGHSTAVSHAAKTLCTGTVSLNGNHFLAQYQMYALDGAPFDQAKISGTLDNKQIVSQFVTENAGDTGILTLTYNSVYERNSAIDLLQGFWQFTDRDGLELRWTIDHGIIAGKDSDQCEYSGVVSLIDPDFNAYLLDMQINECSSVNGAYRGLAYLDGIENALLKTDIAGNYYGFHFDLQKIADLAEK